MGRLINQCTYFAEGYPCVPGEAPLLIVDFIEINLQGNTILDLGGGQGAYSLELAKRGYKTQVADINPDSLAVARANGLDVIDLSNGGDLDSDIVDNVIMIEVLEHVEDPLAFLKNALRCCKKRLIFTAPCGESYKELELFGLTYHHITCTDHRWCFTDKQLNGILQELGCEYTLEKREELFPRVAIDALQRSVSDSFIGKLAMLPIRWLSKTGCMKKSCPSRYYGVITKKQN